MPTIVDLPDFATKPPSARALGLEPMTTSDLRQDDGEHERPAVEDVLDCRVSTEKLETGDARDEEVDGDDRAPWVEAPGVDRGGSQEDRGESRQQELQTRAGVG